MAPPATILQQQSRRNLLRKKKKTKLDQHPMITHDPLSEYRSGSRRSRLTLLYCRLQRSSVAQ